MWANLNLFILFQVSLCPLSISLYDLHINEEPQSDLLVWDECCHVSSMKMTHCNSDTAAALHQRPSEFYFSFYICSLFLRCCIRQSRFPCLSCFLLRRLTMNMVFPCLCLFVVVFLFVCMTLLVCHLSVLCSLGQIVWSKIAASSPWPSGPVSHRIRLCVCLGVSERIRVCLLVAKMLVIRSHPEKGSIDR